MGSSSTTKFLLQVYCFLAVRPYVNLALNFAVAITHTHVNGAFGDLAGYLEECQRIEIVQINRVDATEHLIERPDVVLQINDFEPAALKFGQLCREVLAEADHGYPVTDVQQARDVWQIVNIV